MMKKITLLIGLSLLVSTITVEANNTNKPTSKFGSFNRYHQRPVTFKERNILFYVYLNGDFDFDLNAYANTYYGSSDYFYKGNRKQNSRKKYTPKKRYGNEHYRHHNYISYDYYGRVKRIGNTFIHYDYYGRVIAINNIIISYRQNRLSRVGNLRIVIDRSGHIRFLGSVKPRRHHYYHSYYNNYFYDDYVYEYNDDFFDNDDFENDYDLFDEDADFYYYRSKNKQQKIGKKGKTENKQRLIKRRKPKKIH